MSERKRMTLEELIEAPMQVSLIFEPIEPIVVEEGAEERARRKWGMKEEPNQ